MGDTTTTAAVRKVANVIIPVRDQDRALEFYCGTLGLDKRADQPFGGGYRWIEVAAEGAETPIALCPPPEGTEAGGRDTGIALSTADIDGFHARLKAAGADVDAEVSRMGGPVPPMFWFRDPEGNTLMVVEEA